MLNVCWEPAGERGSLRGRVYEGSRDLDRARILPLISAVPPATCFCLRRQRGPHLCGHPSICIHSPTQVCGTASILGAPPTSAPALGGRLCLC